MTEDRSRDPSRHLLVRGAVVMTVGVILALTLFPSGDEKLAPMLDCLFCGERGVADAIINVILFIPLGAALAFSTLSMLGSAVAGASLAAAIEIVQLFIPGRDTSLSDVLTNTTGVVLGWLLVRHAPRFISLPRRTATFVAVAAAASPVLAIGAAGRLLAPALPRSTYYGQWTPHLRHLESYEGHVLAATLGSVALPSARLEDSDTARALLLAGAPLRVRATAGPRVPGLASLVSVFDENQREIVLLGPDRDDLVFRYRTFAVASRLTQPDLRLTGAFASVRPGDTLAIALWRESAGYCLSLNGERTCRLSFPAGRGWGMLYYSETLPTWLEALLDACWIAGLLLPVGFCTAAGHPALAGGSLVVSLAIMPSLVGLLPAAAGEWAGGMAGVGVGVVLRVITDGAARVRIAGG